MSLLLVNEKEITVMGGLYSLKDLHKASGGDKKYTPYEFFRKKTTIDMIEFLNTESAHNMILLRKTGRYGGSWICKELVYEYAMWLSAEFRVKVIRAFDALINEQKEKAVCIAGGDKKSLAVINKLEELISDDSISPGEKADLLIPLEKEWVDLGKSASSAMSMRRGKREKFEKLQDEILNKIQISFEF